MLLMALPNEHLMTFNQYKDAKTLFASIQTRFGGNEATKKTQKTLLKQISLPSEWNTHVVVWRNKSDLDIMSFDDLYNNFKIIEQEVKGTISSSSSLSSQNMDFVSSPSSTNEINTAYGVNTAYGSVNQNRSQLVYEDLEQIHEDDIEEMDLKWQLALLSMRTIRFFQKTSRKITINGSDTIGYDKSKVECFNCYKMGHFERECRGPRNQDSRNRNQDNSRRTVNVEETSSKAMVAIDGARSQITDKGRKGVGFVSYNVVPPPPTSKSVSEDISNEVRESDALLVKELVSDDKLEKKTDFPTVAKIEFIKAKQQEKPVRKPVKYAKMYRPKAVNTARPNSAVVNAVRANQINAGHPQKEDQGYVDNRCSRHMTGNMSYFSDFKEFDGGYMCDKKNSVLFTNNGCFVLSPDFKLADESQVLLKVPRKNNMYSVDMKNIVPKESLTCLVAKATLDESMLWHRRLGHVNFKTINKLVKENLIRGLPSKRFENDQTCVDCLKGKQHKASSSKDETSRILKSFITKIENLVDKKVKIIRCDNGTEFKNIFMSDFCEKKGIKREFSVARTSQQNGVAERRNRTLIEVARTMLVDSKLPTTFWAEAVNTACYVQNRVLVVKPYNKTPYELFRGRTPAISFMKPFGCHVTILNTLDYLGKFDGKLDEGFFVGYSLNSKAFRVYNIRTRKVEESFHIRFLEDKPIIAGDRPMWLFDIDVLIKSINYVPTVAGTNSNDFTGTEESIGAGISQESGIDDQERSENSTQDVYTAGPSINTSRTNVNTSSLNINTVSPTVTIVPLEATHVDFFGDET
ncbi:putative ribonuclease H-like domain-containing protein [Tanacetum coccineum]